MTGQNHDGDGIGSFTDLKELLQENKYALNALQSPQIIHLILPHQAHCVRAGLPVLHAHCQIQERRQSSLI